MSSQVVGHKYFMNHVVKLGGPIDGIHGYNVEKRGWNSITESKKNPLATQGVYEINKAKLFGSQEGGIEGNIHVYTGTANQPPNLVYKEYYPLASGYPYESYVVFTGKNSPYWSNIHSFNSIYDIKYYLDGRPPKKKGFYIGNANILREICYCPQRINITDDGKPQWYPSKAAIYLIPPEVTPEIPQMAVKANLTVSGANKTVVKTVDKIMDDWTESKGVQRNVLVTKTEIPEFIGDTRHGDDPNVLPDTKANFTFDFSVYANHMVSVIGMVMRGSQMPEPYYPSFSVSIDGEAPSEAEFYNVEIIKSDSGGAFATLRLIIQATCKSIAVELICKDHQYELGSGPAKDESYSSEMFNTHFYVFYPQFAVKPPEPEPKDINIVHEIYGLLVDDTALGLPKEMIDDVNFRRAADRIFSEQLGVSLAFTDKDCSEAISELCAHGDMGLRLNRQLNQYQLVLFRDDWFSQNEIHTLPERSIVEIDLNFKKIKDIPNRVDVKYYNRTKMDTSSFSISDVGRIKSNKNRVNPVSLEFPYFYKFRNASIVANWQLKRMSSILWTGTVETNHLDARLWNKYDLVKLYWSNKWSDYVIVRILNITISDTVTFEFEEFIPFLNDAAEPSAPDDLVPKPSKDILDLDYITFEVPYYDLIMNFDADEVNRWIESDPYTAFISGIATQRQISSPNASVYLRNEELDPYEKVLSSSYVGSATLAESLYATDSYIVVNGFEGAAVGSRILLQGEWMIFKSYDATNKRIHVARACLDTYPTSIVFDDEMVNLGQYKLYIYDSLDIINTKYSINAQPHVVMVASSPLGEGKLPEGPKQVFTIGRASKPYPPANIKIQDFSAVQWDTIIVNAAVDNVISWSHRNKFQQTVPTMPISWFDPSITKEAGVTYTVQVIQLDYVAFEITDVEEDHIVIPANTLIATQDIVIWSSKNGIDSKPLKFRVDAINLDIPLSASTNGYTLSGSTISSANLEAIVDESLSANFKNNGKTLIGKAPAGSTITIEVHE